ncbi:MAG TPA: hypothetical protein VMZ30_07895 [Pyrinomonadaceae bacterium]|nr:hypothetical protein [Pyrinomonadaceae bacterium]
MRFPFSLKPTVLVLLILSAFAAGQSPHTSQSQKLETIPDTYADNEQAYLDLLAEALRKSPQLLGYLVAYSKPGMPPGLFLRRIYGYQNYLVNMRGIEPNRIILVEGGTKGALSTELWLVPKGANPPAADSEFNLVPKLPIKFDVMYPDCPSEMTVYLEETDDSLRFYGRALVANPNTVAKIVAFPRLRTSLAATRRVAMRARAALMKNYHIDSRRIVTSAGRHRRDCSQIELWITETR